MGRSDPSPKWETDIYLNRRFRSTQAFTVEPRPVEAADASLPGSQHRAGIFDPARARFWLPGGGDPVDPISAGNWVMSDHNARAFGAAAARALLRSKTLP